MSYGIEPYNSEIALLDELDFVSVQNSKGLKRVGPQGIFWTRFINGVHIHLWKVKRSSDEWMWEVLSEDKSCGIKSDRPRKLAIALWSAAHRSAEDWVKPL